MTVITKCLLDLDGVLADFIGAAARVHEQLNPISMPPGDSAWNFFKQWGMSSKDFWAPMDYAFWRDMPKTAEADDIFALISGFVGRDNICILSSPCRNTGCAEGKRDWLHQHFPGVPLLLSVSSGVSGAIPPKRFCASPDTLLVDDHSPNIISFREAGGQAFLCPRYWNSAHEHRTRVVAELADYLTHLLKTKFPLIFHGATVTEVDGLREISGLKCQPWEKSLADYTDGELHAEIAARVK